MTVEHFIQRLERVRRAGGQFVARCPAHDDRRPSLSVAQGSDGRILLKCFAGCDPAKVVATLGLTLRDLMPVRIEDRRLIAAAYDYRDEDGLLLYQVVRYAPKSFGHRRPDGSGGWIWNVTDVRRVLYRLPELLAALAVQPDRRVFLVEGEKDVDRLWDLGLLATTNSGGAEKWRAEYSDSLRKRHVIVIPDNDEAGRRHGNQVCRSLIGQAASIKVVTLPGLPPKGDVSDWLDGDGTVDLLKSLAKKATDWSPAAEPSNMGGFSLISAANLMAEPQQSVRWLVEDILPQAGVSVLVAKPKVGKSTMARQLAVAVARGEDFLGRDTTRGTVVYLALEEKRGEVQAHFASMGVADEEIHIHFGIPPVGAMDGLRSLSQLLKPALVIIDPLFLLARVKDVNAYAEVIAAMTPLVAIARDTGAHLCVVHHGGKGERSGGDSILGSTAIFGSVDTAIVLKRGDRYRTVATIQRYGSDLEESVLEFDPGTRTVRLGESKNIADLQRVAHEIEKATDLLCQHAAEGSTFEEAEILEQVEGKTGLKRGGLRLLVQAGRLERSGKGRKGDPFRYRMADPAVGLTQDARSLVPDRCGERENEKFEIAESQLQALPKSLSHTPASVEPEWESEGIL